MKITLTMDIDDQMVEDRAEDYVLARSMSKKSALRHATLYEIVECIHEGGEFKLEVTEATC